ncbi:MAG: O-methyltransferase [candidate division Zixibacteria bacterium]|nr:O-methyltransferase [candidate division Zixibacteria bacterium]
MSAKSKKKNTPFARQSERLDRYLTDISPERLPVMWEMEDEARRSGFPIIGPIVGRFLYQMAMLTKAKRILELGSGFGYSAYWFALAGGSMSQITMTDTDRGNKKKATDYLSRAKLTSHFDFRVGNALAVLKKLDGPFDIILNDIDKKDYPKTIDLVAEKLKKGGLFITDNVIWSGRVLEKNQDDTTRAIVQFTQELYADSRFFTTILPIRDGIAVSIRR